jgi:hypothetical protein
MLILAVISFLIGVTLGLRFKVLVIVSAIGLALVVVVLGGTEDGILWLAATMAVVATGLQLGYACGVILRFCVTRAARHHAAKHYGASASTEVSAPVPSHNLGGASNQFETGKQLHPA